jgi:glutathione S-transferase
MVRRGGAVLDGVDMSIVLHRLPLSHFSEKGRALLDFKKLDYRIVEHQLGLAQISVFRLSGQRKVPVIEEDGRVVADSTAIALYLEERHPDPPLLPADAARRREVLALEDRIDQIFGSYAPVVWFDWVVRERPDELPEVLSVELWGAGRGRALASAIRSVWRVGRVHDVVKKSQERTKALLQELCERLGQGDYLFGAEPTLADVAAAGLAFHLEFPHSAHLGVPHFAGVGVPGWADAPEFQRFFDWRHSFYERHLH